MTTTTNNDTKTIIETDILVATEPPCSLIVWNDEVNTFDFVIDALMQVCGHERIQAEQCTLLVHYKGKCDVKNGEFSKLEPMCIALLDRGLSAEIQ